MCLFDTPTNHSFRPSIILTYVQNPEESEWAVEYVHIWLASAHMETLIGGRERHLKRSFSFCATMGLSSISLRQTWARDNHKVG